MTIIAISTGVNETFFDKECLRRIKNKTLNKALSNLIDFMCTEQLTPMSIINMNDDGEKIKAWIDAQNPDKDTNWYINALENADNQFSKEEHYKHHTILVALTAVAREDMRKFFYEILHQAPVELIPAAMFTYAWSQHLFIIQALRDTLGASDKPFCWEELKYWRNIVINASEEMLEELLDFCNRISPKKIEEIKETFNKIKEDEEEENVPTQFESTTTDKPKWLN